MTTMIVPDRVGEILAWRAWYIVFDKSKQQHRLGSINSKHIWEPSETVEATCIPLGLSPATYKGVHTAPHEDCTCGIHAAKSLTQALVYARKSSGFYGGDQDHSIQDVCLGQVQLWGKVEEGSLAYRAQYAYPKVMLAPYIRGEIIAEVAELYMMEVRSDEVIDALYHKIQGYEDSMVVTPTPKTVRTLGTGVPNTYITPQTFGARQWSTTAGSTNFTIKYDDPKQ